jgi:hypothetical protein
VEVDMRLTISMIRGLRPAAYLSLSLLIVSGMATTAGAQGAQPQAKAEPPVAAPAPVAPAPPAFGAATDKPPAAQSLPVDLDRIRQMAEKQPAVKLDEQQLRFYLLVQQGTPKFADFVGSYDLRNGPTKGGAAMTHQEFLNMVTPKELNELFGATSSSSFAMFQAAVMNAAAQSLIKKAVQDIRQARDEGEVQAIRERIDQELAALLGKEK